MSPYFQGDSPRARARQRKANAAHRAADKKTTSFIHPDIGYIRCSKAKEGVVQFLGLQYATIEDAFAPSVVKNYDKAAITNATKHGPPVLGLSGGLQIEQKVLIQHTLDVDFPDLPASDTEGLTLNLTAPSPDGLQDLHSDRNLPVFCYIHGGGYVIGSANWPQYDLARFVDLSVKSGKPCIAVGLNYRLRQPGFTFSQELRDAGYKPNNGLQDQRAALLWIQKYIAGFGGDPENVTLAGQSAGAASCTFHLQSPEPLFRRVITMSGSSLMQNPIAEEYMEARYQEAVESSMISTLGPADRIQALSDLKAAPTVPMIDPEMPLAAYSFEDFSSDSIDLPGLGWCESLMIGDCEADGSVLVMRIMNRKAGLAKKFRSAMEREMDQDDAEKVLSAYQITADLSDDAALRKVMTFLNDINFYAPTIAYSNLFSSRGVPTYMYRFNETNPWEGPWKDYATHVLDVAFLFQNFNEYLDNAQKHLAETFAEDVFEFIYGGSPWRERGKLKLARVYGPEAMVAVADDGAPEKVGRRNTIFDLADQIEGGMDLLKAVSEAFLAG